MTPVVYPRLPKGYIFKGLIVSSFVVISTASKVIAQPSSGARIAHYWEIYP